MATHIAPAMRVLARPPTLAPSLTRPPTQDPQSSSNGIIVVGFISCRPEYSAHLINRILDSNAFGSGNLDKTLRVDTDEVKDWFKSRRISYYHEQERGIVYLQFSSKHCPVVHRSSSSVGSGFDSAVEEHEFGDLQGMLFMFSACHIIIYIQEGSHFDTENLKNFRVLQAAKHAFAPVVRSRPPPPSQSRSRASSSSRPTTSSANTSPGRHGNTSRNISHMSGLGTYPSFLPGQCTPVTLFVFVDEFLDSSSSNVDATSDVSRSSLPAKGAGPVVVLARPVNKPEASFKKKLQSSLEAQIRFLIKKCRTLSSIETSGPRSGVISPLFFLDASRVAVLLDRVTNQRGESLEYAISLVEEVLNGKATPDSLLLERHNPSTKDDILSIMEFISRQSDVLRGKGGLAGTTNSGSAAGVGMVAVAAAAAAASVAPGKTIPAAAASAPELPSLDLWLSSSETVLLGILTAKRGCIEESDVIRRRPRQRHVSPPQAESTAEPLDIAVSWLERGKGLNTKFSTLWCKKALPSAKDVYLKDLPSCYPSSEHKIHLEKALRAFHSMVKGPSLPQFAKLLEDECTSIWRSGRQQCDAISLTRKPCMHQRHDSEVDSVKPHSSGYFFLHACACGRSRRLRDDPFDFESANLTDCFSDCDKILPSLQLLDISDSGPIKPYAWRLMRLGGSRYYEPSKGLLQSGFSTEKFLQKWVLYLEKKEKLDNLPTNVESIGISSLNTKMELNSASEVKKNYAAMLSSSENSRKSDNVGFADKRNISFGNFTMKKAFSEVVAGSANSHLEFPPLQQTKPSLSVSDKSISKISATDRKESRKLQENFSQPGNRSNGAQTGNPLIRIGSNSILVDGETMKPKFTLEHELAYIGFEHECPHGHRFLLNTKYLNELRPFYASTESGVSSSDGVALSSSHMGSLRTGEIGGQDRVLSGSGRKKLRNNGKSKGMMFNGNNMLPNESVRNVKEGLSSISLDDGGNALSLLNRNLPLYMNCPHCKRLKTDKPPDVKFAGTISQLQRIFLVTPPFPVTLATSPVIQFEETCVPSPIAKEKLRFVIGSEVVLPPESFLVLKLPFVYGVQLEDNTTVHPLNPFEHQPELTAWICKGTALWVVSKEKGLLDKGTSKYGCGWGSFTAAASLLYLDDDDEINNCCCQQTFVAEICWDECCSVMKNGSRKLPVGESLVRPAAFLAIDSC